MSDISNTTSIKKIICVILFLFLFPFVVFAQTLSQEDNKTKALALISVYSAKYNLSLGDIQDVISTVDCETGDTFDSTIQSSARRPDGSRERSFGLAQIFLTVHPDITQIEATDPDFAIDYIIKNFKAGHQSMWSCYPLVKNGTWKSPDNELAPLFDIPSLLENYKQNSYPQFLFALAQQLR